MTVKKLSSVQEIITYLNKKFPKCFILAGESKPLKINILSDLVSALGADIEANIVTKTQLRQALYSYTNNWRYLHGCKLDAKRVDLDGNECETLTVEQVEYAQQKLVESKKLAQLKRKTGNKIQSKTNREANKATKKPRAEQNLIAMTAEDIEKVSAGQLVKFKMNNSIQRATLLNIKGETARIQLNNGLTINISINDLVK